MNIIENAIGSFFDGLSSHTFTPLGKAICQITAQMICLPVECAEGLSGIASDISGTDKTSTMAKLMDKVDKVISGKSFRFSGTTINTPDMLTLFKGLGFAIAFLFFLFAFINLVTQERLTIEQFLKEFIKLFLGFFMIDKSNELYKALVALGAGINKSSYSAITKADVDIVGPDLEKNIYKSLTKIFLGGGGIEDIGGVAQSFWFLVLCFALIVIPMFVAIALVWVALWATMFEINLEIRIRGVFLPIAFGLFSDDGFRGAGARYFKKFLAVCSQGAAVTVLAGLLSMCFGAVIDASFGHMSFKGIDTNIKLFFTIFKAVPLICGLAFATIGLLKKTREVMNDVFGV